jgi:hypothetical protein
MGPESADIASKKIFEFQAPVTKIIQVPKKQGEVEVREARRDLRSCGGGSCEQQKSRRELGGNNFGFSHPTRTVGSPGRTY